MKSADPNVVQAITTTLDKTPIDRAAIINQLTDDNKAMIVSTILDSYVNLNTALEENTLALKETRALLERIVDRERVNDLALRQSQQTILKLQSAEAARINPTTLAKFFLSHEDLVEDYSLGDDNMVYYKDILVDDKTNILLYLSIDLEEFFGKKNVPLSTLINGLKRYLVAKQKQANQYQDALLDIVDDFFSQQVTKTRTRISLKYLRDACKDVPELDLPTIKSLMYDAGYPIKKDKNNTVYFYRRD